MSTISRLFDKRLVIQALRTTSGNKRAFQSTATVDGALQDKVIEMKSNLGIVTSRNWMAYFAIDENIKPGMRIVFGKYTFYVDEVTPRDYGINQHLEVLLKEANE